jgi:hypothetical protein
MPRGWLGDAVVPDAPDVEHPHHRRIARILAALNGDLLRETNCLFGGGTAMALRFGGIANRSIWIFWYRTSTAIAACASC